MDENALDVYPIHHKNLIFNVVTHLDLTFQEIRGMLDYLLEKQAFRDEEDWEEAQLYAFSLGRVEYEVDVSGYAMVVYSRKEKISS